MTGDELWLEAAAGLQADLDADLRDEAYEVFVAEAARSRLQDRVGSVRLLLRCGVTLAGLLGGDEAIDGHVRLAEATGWRIVVPVGAIATISGGRPGLGSASAGRTITSWLREAWESGERIGVLIAGGQWRGGRLAYVARDYVDLVVHEAVVTVPLASVEAWRRVSC
jgi:hypothetical protein